MKSVFLIFILLIPLFSNGQENIINLNQLEGETIILEYDENDFVIEYVGIHFDAPQRVQYQYKMEGLHQEWQEVGIQRKARFNNLSSGEYTFLVKASNADGVWNKTPARLYFKILPPWYWTWWAKIIYLGIFLWSGLFIYRYQHYRHLVRTESARLEQLMATQIDKKENGAASAARDTSPPMEPSSKSIFLDKIKKHIEIHLDDSNYSVEDLAKDMNLSRQQLYRKTKSFTGKSVAGYVRMIRLHFGKKMLQTTNLNVSEIAYQVGFSDPSYFSKSYSEEFGYAPSEESK